MALAYVDHDVWGSSADATQVTLDVPTHTSGDLMIAFILSDAAESDYFVQADWVHIDHQSQGGTMACSSFYRIATGSEPASYTFTGLASDDCCGCIIVISKSSGTWDLPPDANQFAYSYDGSSTTISNGTVTTLSGDMLVTAYMHDGNGTIDTAPAGMTLTELVMGRSTISMAVCYDESAAGNPSHEMVFVNSDNLLTMSVVASIGAAGSTSPSPRANLQGPLSGPLGGPI